MTFSTITQVRFAHVDAAAIVFYPRYLEMLNAAVEDWFAHLGCDFHTLHLERKIGTPTVKLDCEFVAPSKLGDILTIELDPRELGRSSCTLCFRFEGPDSLRMKGNLVIVCMDLRTHRAMPWPIDLRGRMVMDGAVEKA